jgi:two-component system, chemotaxis family, sensor kinase CheA
MIEDLELRSLFKTESEEHIRLLEEGLLHLETNPTDGKTLEEVFRAAHSLKGGSGMLGLRPIERLAHGFEDALNGARQGKVVLSSGVIDQLCKQLDTMRQLVDEAVSDRPSHATIASALEPVNGFDAMTHPIQAGPAIIAEGELEAAIDHPGSEEVQAILTLRQAAAPLPAYIPSSNPVPQSSESAPTVPLEAPSGRYRIDTMRVEPQKLDMLMRHASELTVAKIRIARRLTQIAELVTLCEEWGREMFVAHSAVLAAQNSSVWHAGTHRLTGLVQRDRERIERLGALVNDLRNVAYEDSARLDSVVATLEEGIRNIRLLPLAAIFQLFPRMVRDLARDLAKEVQLIIEGGDTAADKRILEEMKDPLMHMIRNAIDHGLEAPDERQLSGKPRLGTIRLRAHLTSSNLVIEVSDDGRGLDLERIKSTALKRRLRREEELAAMTSAQIQALIFAPGFSTSPLVTDVSGRGVGLDVVWANVERLKGSIQVESSAGHGCTLRICLPKAVAATRVLIVMADRRSYALPIEYVQTTRQVSPREIFPIEGRDTLVVDGKPVSLAYLSALLDIPSYTAAAKESKHPDPDKPRSCIILSVGDDQIGLFVDALLDEQEVMVKSHSAILKRVRNVSGATILGTGEVCMVLNPLDLLRSVRQRPTRISQESSNAKPQLKHAILLVEDSITTRTQEKRILESAGYEVVAAVNGVDALQKLSSRAFDAVVSDVEMPHMDGLMLTERVRREPKYNELPIILVTSLASEEDKRRGVEVGANAYIAKPTFDQELLLDTLRRLI